MTDRIYTVDKICSILKTMSVINDNGSGIAIVIDEDDKYLGLVTDGDIRRAIISGSSPQDKIKDIVNTKAIVGSDNDNISQLRSQLSIELKAIPILDKEGYFKSLLQYKDLSIPAAKPGLHGNELLYLTDCVLSNWISSQGEYVDRFEEIFADFVGTKYAISCSNGTSALHLALLAAGVGEGDEVIVPSFTWISTANAVRYVGADVIFADINPETLNIDYEATKNLISKRTKAIIPVHLYGQPADLEMLNKVCVENEIFLIEDAAEAHGATYKNDYVGSIGSMGCFSFFGNKIITTGEGGMITTNNVRLSEKIKLFRDHGKSKDDPYWHDVVGYNYRMTNMQAAIGLAQMERINEILKDKIRTKDLFLKFLSSHEELIMPPCNTWSKNIHWLFTIRIKGDDIASLKARRDKVINVLEDHSVGARRFFYPIHEMTPYHQKGLSLPNTEKISASGICLPSYFGMREEDVERISNLVIESLDS